MKHEQSSVSTYIVNLCVCVQYQQVWRTGRLKEKASRVLYQEISPPHSGNECQAYHRSLGTLPAPMFLLGCRGGLISLWSHQYQSQRQFIPVCTCGSPRLESNITLSHIQVIFRSCLKCCSAELPFMTTLIHTCTVQLHENLMLLCSACQLCPKWKFCTVALWNTVLQYTTEFCLISTWDCQNLFRKEWT